MTEPTFNIQAFQDDIRQQSAKFPHSPETRSLYLMTEVGEAMREVLDLVFTLREATPPPEQVQALKERLGMELYDIIWNTVDLANRFNIDLAAAFAAKEAYNRERWGK